MRRFDKCTIDSNYAAYIIDHTIVTVSTSNKITGDAVSPLGKTALILCGLSSVEHIDDLRKLGALII